MTRCVPVTDLPRKLAWRDERMASLRALKAKLGAFSTRDGDGSGTG